MAFGIGAGNFQSPRRALIGCYSVLAKRSALQNAAGALHPEAVSCMLPVGPETKMGIPIQWLAIDSRRTVERTGFEDRQSRRHELLSGLHCLK